MTSVTARRDDDARPPQGLPVVDDPLGVEWSVWDADVHLYTQQFPDAAAAEDAAASGNCWV